AWGFPLREIKPTVHMWHGQADTLVSPAMGSYLAEQIPHCEAHLLAGEGHLLVIDHMAEIIEELQRS
ncbi:MAG: hypothetical protein J2P15_24325, partial [Micromonosporaceae bacterium]|nr:hypothetical protein [Micromonosporaceae bacterium]